MNHLNIKLKTKTWNRDSYGLYDYETTDVAKIQININKESLIIREGNRIRLGINEENSLTDTICQFNEEDGFIIK